MNFFREHKFLAILVTVTAIIAIALIVGIFMVSGKYKESKGEFDKNRSELIRLQSGKVYPTDENAKKLTTLADENELATTKLARQVAMQKKYKLPSVTAAQVPGLITQAGITIRALAEKHQTQLPEGFYFGLERFKDTPPSSEETAHIVYQLEAYQDLLAGIIQGGATSVDMMTASANLAQAADAQPIANNTVGTVTFYPLQIKFTGSNTAIQNIINFLANHPSYIFDIRIPYFENEKREGLLINTEDSNEQTDNGGTTEENNYDASILLGNEKITTQLDVDLVRFEPSAAIRDGLEEKAPTETTTGNPAPSSPTAPTTEQSPEPITETAMPDKAGAATQ